MDLSILLVQYRPDEGELRRTLASLLRQSCRDFELVVADDGSDEDFFRAKFLQKTALPAQNLSSSPPTAARSKTF